MNKRAFLLIVCLLLCFGGLQAQTEPESSTNVLVLSGPHDEVEHVYEQGTPIEFVMIDRQADLQKGTIEEVTDSAVVVNGQEFAVSKIGMVYRSNQQKYETGLGVGIGALLALVVSSAAWIYFGLIGLYAAATLLVIFIGLIFALAFLSLATIAAIYLAGGSRKRKIMGKHFRLKVAQLLHQYPAQPR